MRSAVLALVLAACAKPAPPPADDKLATMTVDEVEAAIATHRVTPVDCNGPLTRKKYGVVPGAILVSDEETYGESELPSDKGARLVFYCASDG